MPQTAITVCSILIFGYIKVYEPARGSHMRVVPAKAMLIQIDGAALNKIVEPHMRSNVCTFIN